MKRIFRQYGLFIVILLAASSLFTLNLVTRTPPSLAHPEGPEHGHIRPNIEDIKKAHQRDAQPPQNLPSLTGAVAACSDGVAAGYPCSNIDLLAFMPLADIGGDRSNSAANDIWGWTDPQTGKEYAIIGRVFGTSFIDISDTVNPVYLGELSTHGAFGSSWRDIKVYNDHAFIVSEANQHGMQVFDLTQLRNVSNPPVDFAETAHYKKNASAHNIVINEDSGFAYIVGAAGKNNCSGGLHMVDISNPTRPTFEGCFSSDGYTHDAQCVNYTGPDPDYQGAEICINSNEDTITVVDVTNKDDPSQVSRIGYTEANYTHQGWLTEDQEYFILDDELDEINDLHNTQTYVWDVRDLDNPVHIGTYVSNTPNIDHNQYIKGDFSYQAQYRAGLRILDISDVVNGNLSEVAYFDIYPADNDARFNGAWSNYPYFDSGVVIVSGIEQGLYILQPNLGPVDNPPTVTLTDPAEGATVSGDPVLLAATASDDNGVTQVEFFVDGNFVGVATTSPYSVTWNSTTVGEGARVISATATDTIGQMTNDSNNITVDNVPDPSIHSGDLDGESALGGPGGKWSATVTITVHDSGEAVILNATVNGSWSAGVNGSGSCTTNGDGQCDITRSKIKRNSDSVTFTVTSVAHASLGYTSGDNHDPDGDSNGTVIVILKP